jgi:hypothetical protein
MREGIRRAALQRVRPDRCSHSLAVAGQRGRWVIQNHFFVTAGQGVGQTRDSSAEPSAASMQGFGYSESTGRDEEPCLAPHRDLMRTAANRTG